MTTVVRQSTWVNPRLTQGPLDTFIILRHKLKTNTQAMCASAFDTTFILSLILINCVTPTGRGKKEAFALLMPAQAKLCFLGNWSLSLIISTWFPDHFPEATATLINFFYSSNLYYYSASLGLGTLLNNPP